MVTFNQVLQNAYLMTRAAFARLLDPDERNIDKECGYPEVIGIQQYKKMYDREGLASRVIALYPEESWAVDPEVYETEDQTETEFEKRFAEVLDKHQLFHYLQRVDELSGIGYFGVLLIGVDDGKGLNEPVEGINERGEAVGTPPERNIIYLRPFDQSQVEIATYEQDETNPRYGLPTTYNIRFTDLTDGAPITGIGADSRTKTVHWSRVLHVADNRKSSEVFGIPRIRNIYNRLYDLRKVLSGSGEMFWKGAFPGYSFEVDPKLVGESNVQIDTKEMKEEFDRFSNSLQRYLALQGVSAKSLAPQVASPMEHMKAQLQVIAIVLGCPVRVLLGSEEAKLASSQDMRTWNKRLTKRQHKYITPWLLRPFIDRLMLMGVLPTIEKYDVDWPDLNAPSDDDKAATALKVTEAMAKYVGGNVDVIIPPLEWLTVVLGMTLEEAESIIESASERIAETEDSDDPILQKRQQDQEQFEKQAALDRGSEAEADDEKPTNDNRTRDKEDK